MFRRTRIHFLSEYFGIEQPLKKIDLVDLKNFEAQAMENWGLVIFRDQFLVKDESTTPSILTVLTILNKLVHFWFGNLVTPKCWDSLWLKERFADWMSYEVASKI